MTSIVVNFFFSIRIQESLDSPRKKKTNLVLGIAFNLVLIGYYKYANFFVSSVTSLFDINIALQAIVLPLGISFYTFQQIAYLVDTYKGETNYKFVDYSLFVTFFPQLIAGPIIHHSEVMPQFASKKTRISKSVYKVNYEDLAVGITIFSMGLFKKVVFADNVAEYANQIFSAANTGVSPSFFDAWIGALAYTLQLYFDFSGYSDMAIGSARMFGIKLSANFNSPYKSTSIVEFWRRWHITLSNFLRDYLYIPLGGNRKGQLSRYKNLMITMLLGGLWHGAGWSFVLWGGLHGMYLVINHYWNSLLKSQRRNQNSNKSSWWSKGIAWLITFIAVVIAWVLFRAENINTAMSILKGMVGLNGVALPNSLLRILRELGLLQMFGMEFNGTAQFAVRAYLHIVAVIGLLLIIVCFTPNTQEWLEKYNPTYNQTSPAKSEEEINSSIKKWRWQPNAIFSALLGIIGFFSVKILLTASESEFLYFNF